MAALSIRGLDDSVEENLCLRSAGHGQSVEASPGRTLAPRLSPRSLCWRGHKIHRLSLTIWRAGAPT
ncbi:hypothetical protein ACFY36_01985 [Actinoplanes sp. NPDC000266]